MNISKLIPLILSALVLAGCTSQQPNPWTTPAAIAGDVRDVVALGLIVYPKAAEEVAVARDVICKASGNTNFSAAVIVADLEKAGITNSNSKIIVNGVLLIWNRVEPLVGTNIQAYSEAVCTGMRQGTGEVLTGRDRALGRSPRKLPPHLK